MFVDREEPQKIVSEEYEKIKLALNEGADYDFKILNFYGLGGLGKSFLAEKVKISLKENHPQKHRPYIMWDADQENNLNYNMIEVLRMLRNLLVKSHGFDFSDFDNYLVHYKELSGETVHLTTFDNEASKAESKEMAKTIIDTTIQALGIFSPIDLIDTLRSNIKNKKKATESRRIMDEIDGISMKDRMATLKNKFINNYNSEIKKMGEPMVIFIDTFEDFNLDSDWLFSGEKDEVLGYGLCQLMSGTLWVISGRDKLPYEPSKDTEDLMYFDFFQLNEFTKEDTLYFWKTYAKSNDIGFAERIWKETNGNPLLLSLYYDIYTHQIEEGHQISIDEFFEEQVRGRKNKVLIERYLRYLEKDSNTQSDKSLGQLIRLLACLGTWSYGEEEEWPESLTKYIVGERSDLFSEIYGKTLVFRNEDGTYRLDRTVREILLKESNKGNPLVNNFMKKDVFNYLVASSKKTEMSDERNTQLIKLAKLLNPKDGEAFYDTVFKGLEHVFQRLITNREYTKFMSLYIRILNECNDEYLCSDIGIEKINEAILLADDYSVYDVAETLERLVNRAPTSPKIRASLGHLYIKEGNINRAEAILKQGINSFNGNASHYVYFDLFYGLYLVEQIRQDVDQMATCLRVLEGVIDTIDEIEYWLIYHTALLTYHQTIRDTETAVKLIKVFDDIWSILPNNEKEQFAIYYYQFGRVAGLVYGQKGQYEEALRRYAHSKKGFANSFGEDSHDYWHITDNIAETYRLMGQSEKAYSLYETIYINRYRINSINNHYTIRAAINYGFVLNLRNEYSKAIEVLEEAIEGAHNVLPQNHRLFGRLYNNLADAYKYNAQYNKAIDTYIIALEEKSKNLQFEEHELIRDRIKLNEAAFYMALENKDKQLAGNVLIHLEKVVYDIKNVMEYSIRNDQNHNLRILEEYYDRIQHIQVQIDSFLDREQSRGLRSKDFRSTMDIVLFLPIRFKDCDQALHVIYRKNNGNDYYAFCIDNYKEFIGFRFSNKKLSPTDLEYVLILRDATYCENKLDYEYADKFEDFGPILERLSLYDINYEGEQLEPEQIISILINNK